MTEADGPACSPRLPAWVILSDAKWLRFVLEQLLSNASKYSSRPDRDGQVIFRLSHAGGETLLEVADNGIGIPPEDLGRVFDPFFTGSNGRDYPQSTGLGLSSPGRSATDSAFAATAGFYWRSLHTGLTGRISREIAV